MVRTWHSFRTMSLWPCVIIPSILTVFPYKCLKFKTLKETDKGANTQEAWYMIKWIGDARKCFSKTVLSAKDYEHGMCRILNLDL